MNKNLISLQLILSLLFSIHAEDVTKVLQNGLNGYSGCTDSYIYRMGADPESVNMNFGSNELLKTAN